MIKCWKAEGFFINMKKYLLLIFALFTYNSIAQYTPNDKDLVLTTFKREFNREILKSYINSNNPVKINAVLLSIANSGDSSLAADLINNIKDSEYRSFALTQTGIIKNEFKSEDLLNKLQSENNNFEYTFRLYRMPKIPGDKKIYVDALRKSLSRKDNKTIPYLLGCLRKLKYFPDDDHLASEIFKLNAFDLKIEVVKLLPYYIKKESVLLKYLLYFAEKNENIVRQASVSISEITEPFLYKQLNEFLKNKIKSSGISDLIKNEMLLSYIKLNHPSFVQVNNLFGDFINKKGWIDAAQLIGDQDSKVYLIKLFNEGDYHVKLYSVIALEELNKDSSLTAIITGLKSQDNLLKDLLDESARTKGDFESIWNNAFKYKTAEIITSKGKIKLKLLPEYAPLSVGNFCKLASEKFFNGNLFHRVVPGFVIQTGDTTNTGWGGPGYSITTEVSPLSYNKGVLGMASSGKDTEGSQWFITTGNYPHLDGRYSVFGNVIDGMNVVENITQEDKIISVRLYK